MDNIWTVKLGNGATLTVRGAETFDFKHGDYCVFQRDYFEDIGRICCRRDPETAGETASLPQILRMAGEPELIEAEENDR